MAFSSLSDKYRWYSRVNVHVSVRLYETRRLSALDSNFKCTSSEQQLSFFSFFLSLAFKDSGKVKKWETDKTDIYKIMDKVIYMIHKWSSNYAQINISVRHFTVHKKIPK